VQFADESMEAVSYYAIEASSDLAKERGRYATYEGSLWSKGILPIDSIKILKEARGNFLQQDESQTLDWDALRDKIKTQGMRNSNTMAIAPTATISNICGVSQSIEPTYQNIFVKSNLSGEFTVINPYMVEDLKVNGLWDEVMINDLKYYDGSLQQIDRIPEDIKALYTTAFEMDTRWLIEAASRRQKWLDQAQSLNLYMAEPSGKKMDNMYKLAWVRGLKTTYYLRSMGATAAEKTTSAAPSASTANLAPVPSKPKAESSAPAGVVSVSTSTTTASSDEFDLGEGQEAPKACSILEPDCEACQ
jgi:ribonucleoside-diphosphate reductase alpha chain